VKLPFHALFEKVTGSLAMGLVLGGIAFGSESPRAVQSFVGTAILCG
jgi:hypothetical protein